MAKINKRKDTKKVSHHAHFAVRGNRCQVKREAQENNKSRNRTLIAVLPRHLYHVIDKTNMD